MFRRDRSLKWAAFDVCGSIEPLFTVSLLRIRTSGFAPSQPLGYGRPLLTPGLDLENFRLPTFSSSFAHSFRYYLYLSFSRFNRRAPFPDSSGWVLNQNLDLEVQSAISYMESSASPTWRQLNSVRSRLRISFISVRTDARCSRSSTQFLVASSVSAAGMC